MKYLPFEFPVLKAVEWLVACPLRDGMYRTKAANKH